MKKFKLTLNLEYEVMAEDEEDAYAELEMDFNTENTTANNQFWDNLKVKEIKNAE